MRSCQAMPALAPWLPRAMTEWPHSSARPSPTAPNPAGADLHPVGMIGLPRLGAPPRDAERLAYQMNARADLGERDDDPLFHQRRTRARGMTDGLRVMAADNLAELASIANDEGRLAGQLVAPDPAGAAVMGIPARRLRAEDAVDSRIHDGVETLRRGERPQTDFDLSDSPPRSAPRALLPGGLRQASRPGQTVHLQPPAATMPFGAGLVRSTTHQCSGTRHRPGSQARRRASHHRTGGSDRTTASGCATAGPEQPAGRRQCLEEQ